MWRLNLADEYVISVVLEGKAGSAKSAIKGAADAEQELQNKTLQANVAFVTQLARMEALTSGLNQTIGGIDKMTGGLERTGVLSKEGAEKMRKFTGALQAMAGPMEVAIALKKLHIAITGVDTGATELNDKTKKKLTITQRALNAAQSAMPLMLLIVGALLLFKVLVRLEEKMGWATWSAEKLGDAFRAVAEYIKEATDAVDGFTDAIGDRVVGPAQARGRLID